MKKLSYIFIAACIIGSSCTKDISSLNINPKAATNVPASALFLQGELNLADDYASTSVASAPFRVLSQEWTEIAYVYEAQYVFSAYQAPDGWWNNMYEGVLNNLGQAKAKFPDDVSDPVALKNDLIITDILEVYTYNMLVATYGPIPYNEAENSTIPFPKYDDEKSIFTDLLQRLDTCIADIDVSGTAMGASDQIYGGDPTEWKKFAATLELKIAMELAHVDPSTAATAAQAAVATGVFTSDDDDALFTFDPSSPGNSSPMWNALVYSGRHDFMPADLIVNTMDSLNDPRMPFYFTTATSGPDAGQYVGGVPGNTNGYNGTFSDFAPQIETAAYPADLLDYSETEFYLAEAAAQGINVGGTAETHYDNAITSSIEFWGGTAGQAATYLLQPTVAYTTAGGLGSTWQEKIGYQEWISFYNRNWDSWTVIRKLGYPDINVVNPPVGAHGSLPLRYTYPNNEATSNSVNYAAAAAMLPGGQDVVSAKLYWEP
jgi:Starch-binding associating with outer membrane